MPSDELTFLLLDRQGAYLDTIDPLTSITRPMWNDVGMAALTVADDHRSVTDAVADGEYLDEFRLRVLYRGERILEGVMEVVDGVGPQGTLVLTALDDLDLINYVLGWQVPNQPITNQGGAEYWRQTGPTETVVRAAIVENAVTRLGLPWNVPASEGRGLPSRTLELRQHPLGDKVLPMLREARLGMRITRDMPPGELGASLSTYSVEFYEGEVVDKTLTPETGILDAWKWTRQRAKATRMNVGGEGQGIERRFDRVVDTALEARIGIREAFTDARMTEDGADLKPRGVEELAAKAPSASISATLNETAWFRYRETYDLGDIVPVKIGRFETTDVISQAEISDTPTNGLVITPKIGLAATTTDERMVALIRRLLTQARDIEKR